MRHFRPEAADRAWARFAALSPAPDLAVGQVRGLLWATVRRDGWSCGYVAVPAGHPRHGHSVTGATYASAETPPGVPAVPGAWWLGTDNAGTPGACRRGVWRAVARLTGEVA